MFFSKPRSYLVWALMAWTVSVAAQSAVNGRDFIVAVVDSVPITNHDVALRAPQLRDQLKQQGRPVPQGDALLKAALERLIVEKALLQHAKEAGVTVEDEAVTQAEQRLAAQSQLSVDALHKKVKAEGSSVARLRQNLLEQLTLQRLTERNVPSRIRVSDVEIDQAIRERQNASVGTNPDIELGHVLVAIPEKASDAEVAALQTKAQTALAHVKRGDDLARVAKEFSDGAERDKGGLMGLRAASRYPTLFVDAIKNMNVGDATLVRSGAGFHVLKVVTKRASSVITVTQTHPRHILLRPGGQLSQTTARAQLAEYKRQIETGKADFAKLAREHSQDGSGPEGGDLGWVSPGMFVPEFEEVMNQLQPGQMADPTISRFGVHLIQVLERREAPISERELRDMARNNLREKKFDETYQLWAQEVRGRAYVEYRDAPQ
ncbi:peptidylprolyl isomerase [Limnohabitans sp. INBF002]|uniref:peptidylprolyl isomerase n=1 Tax=Limnohabitans sp. INBF002 TaxID=2986280 RepID=UPI0024909FEE|nr:peptidylprolyl isomerase [Limnohabitans sp. INBF002]